MCISNLINTLVNSNLNLLSGWGRHKLACPNSSERQDALTVFLSPSWTVCLWWCSHFLHTSRPLSTLVFCSVIHSSSTHSPTPLLLANYIFYSLPSSHSSYQAATSFPSLAAADSIFGLSNSQFWLRCFIYIRCTFSFQLQSVILSSGFCENVTCHRFRSTDCQSAWCRPFLSLDTSHFAHSDFSQAFAL